MRMERQEGLGHAPAAAQSRAAVRTSQTSHDGTSGANSLDAMGNGGGDA